MKNRRDFLKEVCPTVAFAFFGISFLEACSSGSDDDVETTIPGSGSGSGSGSGGGTNSNGFTEEGNSYIIDLEHSNFTSPPSSMGTGLSNVGGWMNGKSIGISALFLRISDTEIQAYTNVCPHQSHDEWTYRNNIFKCSRSGANHGKEYSDDCNSSLTCYNPTLDGNTLNLTIS